MEGLKLTIALIIAILLQWTLRNVAEPFAYIDFPLIIVVYAALQTKRDQGDPFWLDRRARGRCSERRAARCKWILKNA